MSPCFSFARAAPSIAASTDPAESLVLAPLVLTLQLPVVLYFIFLVRCYPRRPVEKLDVASVSLRAAA